LVESAFRHEPLLKGLMATGAGYLSKATSHRCRRSEITEQAIFVYCVKGKGWCEVAGRLHSVGDGDLLVLPPRVAHDYGARSANPWTIHWALARGENLKAYLETLGASANAPVVRVGEDLRLALLFNEVFKALERGPEFSNLLLASTTLALLLAVSIRLHRDCHRSASGTVEKVAQAIVHMSEHLDEPPRMSALAALANLSQAHFSVLFKEQTGCSPRDYLHLLRIHRACQLLQNPALSVKEVATRLGYQDQFHFSRQFKAFQGMSPSEYRG